MIIGYSMVGDSTSRQEHLYLSEKALEPAYFNPKHDSKRLQHENRGGVKGRRGAPQLRGEWTAHHSRAAPL